MTTRRTPAHHGQLGLGLMTLVMLCSCGAGTAAVQPSNEHEWAGEFEDCSRWANLCGLLFRSCRRLSLSSDGTFRLVVIRKDDSEVINGNWRGESEDCLRLEPNPADELVSANVGAPAAAPADVAESDPPEVTGLEELCAIDPDACVRVPWDVAMGWSSTVCRARSGVLMQFSNGGWAELEPQVAR